MSKKTQEELNADQVIDSEMIEWADWVFVEKNKTKEKIEKSNKNAKEESTEILKVETPTAWVLTPQDIEKKEEFKWMIDLYDTNSLIKFWADAWTGITKISETILADTKVRKLKAVWEELNELVTALETWDFGWKEKWMFAKMKRWLKKKKNWRISIEDVIQKIEWIVDSHISTLEGYIPLLDDLLSLNEERFYELKLYILAWKEKIQDMQNEFEETHKEFLENDGVIDEFEQQKLMSLQTNINIFIQKVQDLERLCIMAFTNASQINAMRNASSMIKMKMESAKVSIIPIYRMQWVISAVNSDITSIVDSSKAISDSTQNMLMKNADMTWDLARWAATEFNRPVIENETIAYVVKSITTTYKDVEKIAKESEKKCLDWNKKLEKLLSTLSSSSWVKQLEAPKDGKKK